MIFSSRTKKPKIHATAYIAPTATVSGEVTIEAGCAILHGAILTAEGAPLRIGAECVVMEHAVIKSSGGSAIAFPVEIGEQCIIGPHAYISGATIASGCFIASGAKVFNGASLASACSLALGAVAHVGARLPESTRVPIGHIAFGDPARVVSPDRAPEVHASIDFFATVFNLEPAEDVRAQAAQSYAKFLRKAHAQDAVVGDGSHVTKAAPRRGSTEEPPQQQMTQVEGVVDAMMLELQELEHRRAEALKKKKS